MRFEVWAPEADTVVLEAAEVRYPMERDPLREGWWSAAAEAVDGDRYGFRVDDGPLLPDPVRAASRTGLTGRARWSARGARLAQRVGGAAAEPGRAVRAARGDVHPGGHLRRGGGAAGPSGGAGDHPCVADAGLPVPGRQRVGVRGVSLWAVHEPYGGPEGLKRFVDTAHGLGLGVVLDVVHNHLGPSGNYLPAFGPYFTDTHHTPWGAAVNLDAPGSDEVRAFLIGSSLAWLRDYRLDGLRLDAVHALADTRALTFLEELSTAVDALAAELGRPLGLIAESDLCDPRTTTPRTAGGLGLHAQWNDDFHHALHTALTGESQGYYADFARAPLAALAKTVTSVFFHNGTFSSFRGRSHGRPVDVSRSPPTASSATRRPTTRSATGPWATASPPPSPPASRRVRRPWC